MIGYRLCRVRAAEHPFFIESTAVNVWTIEELCYFMYRNPELIDGTLAGLPLTRWVAEELALPKTALSMEQALKTDAGIAAFALPLFQASGYLTEGEIRAFCQAVETLVTRPVPERLRRRADALVRNRRYGKAEEVYLQASEACGSRDNALKAGIWHNSGVAAMQMLEYEKACCSFEKACKLRATRRDLETYLLAVRITKPFAKYQAKAESLGADKEMLDDIEARLAAANAEEVKLPEDTAAFLSGLRQAYHREAGT